MSALLEIHGSIAVIRIDNPPVNGLGLSTRTSINEFLQESLSRDDIAAIVLTGTAKAFSGGADIKEFGTDKTFASPNLPSVLDAIENARKPVIAAINGVCMGGGLELALACHYRITMSGCPIALPEVKLGLLPGAGGTQRLPRLLDMATCIDMVSNGSIYLSENLRQSALFDSFIDDQSSLLSSAIEFAIAKSAARPIPKTSERPVVQVGDPNLFEAARAVFHKKSPFLPAPIKCIDVLEMSTLHSFEDGLKKEREAFQFLLNGAESKALRHIFVAERAVGKIDGVNAETTVRTIKQVAVIGAGTMGAGIAMNFASAGIPVQILDAQAASLERGLLRIRQNYGATVAKGRLSQEQCERNCALISGAQDYEQIRDADLVIEAVFEQMEVKEEVFRSLDRVMKPSAILASNTSTLDLDQIAQFTSRPTDVIGLHFFSPANVMELLEIVRGKLTSPEVLATCANLSKKIKKTAVVAGVCDGFIGNRMLAQYTKQAAFLLEEGCTPQQVDRAIENFGFAMGPFRVSDLAGNDISWAIRKARRISKPDEIYSDLGDLLCEQGRFGQKTQAGWYDYTAGDRTAHPSALVANMIGDYSQKNGFKQRSISDQEIVERLIFALANEGRKILEDKIAARSSDIDVVYLKGYGFPRHRGGPMFYAELVGWDYVDAAIDTFSRGHRGETWA
ncbi:enoyl-CoA hydratase/isomerase family protein [Undibacterium sp. LX40W]|uniref:Enoyl-CoA hydratase/isomerase family protein n=1 Tax=Undibacterium nitidum TaxID=2762298 RepID=A0A923HLF8_9BURK|nr:MULTISPECIES: 3-hydroxyacyl-CoA dehydrogenase NAD-binding domain-containing protein [Undibacterium]MBC3879981.1 enoyl-CoA hydratase/isomerase family protein [Undibacterium nitidum]MBC3891283.1 enoyl-CoA hydratase/isomerase family protein [Undibacterium sp. LX40W]